MLPTLHFRAWARIVLGIVTIVLWSWSLGCILKCDEPRAVALGILGLITILGVQVFED